QAVDASWKIVRYTRHQTLAIDRRFRQRLEFQARQLKLAAERREALNKGAQDRQEANGETSERARLLELQQLVHESPEDVDELLNRAADERDHARALEEAIKYYKELDNFLSVAIERRNDAIEQLEWYRKGLGSALRRATDEVIDAEFETAEPTP